MNVGTMQFFSQSLGRHVTYTVILPDPATAGPGPYPVLYQLHGRSDDHTAWVRYSNLVRHVAGLPFIVALPDGGVSFWLNCGPTQRYEDFMIHDLSEHLAQAFHVRPGKAAIGGLSMGGFGALRLGLKYSERFASVWGHSSAVWDTGELKQMSNLIDELRTEFSETDVYGLAAQVAKERDGGAEFPIITFDCGTEDFLIEQNRRFHRHLDELGIPHTYKEHPGAHTWEYWDEHVKEALLQHKRALGLER